MGERCAYESGDPVRTVSKGPDESSAGFFQPRLLLSVVDQPRSEYRLSLGVAVNLPGEHAQLVPLESETVEVSDVKMRAMASPTPIPRRANTATEASSSGVI